MSAVLEHGSCRTGHPKPFPFWPQNGGSSSAQSLACGISDTRLRDFAQRGAAPDGCLIHASARLPLEAWLFS
jgi:hypothetical protein